MRRTTVWKPKAASTIRRRGPSAKDLEGLHRHGCTTCSVTYEDACSTPLANGQCRSCSGLTPPVWEANLRPVECCINAQLATRDEQNTYRLGGEDPWWLCPKCKRPQIYKPAPRNVGQT